MTRDQIINLPYGTVMHYAPACKRTVGPKGGVTVKNERWRFSGAAQTWKTRPADVRRPIKHGLKISYVIDHTNMADFVLERECPVCQGALVPDSADRVTTIVED